MTPRFEPPAKGLTAAALQPMQQQRHTFSQPHTRAHNHHGVVVFELCSQGWTWNDAHCPPNHTTAPPASAVKNTHSLIFTRPTAPLHWKASGRDLYGYGHPSTTSVYFPCCCSVRPPCMVCVSVCSVFTCMCALRKCMCVCVFARTSHSGVNWAGCMKLGSGRRPRSLSSGSRRNLQPVS